MGEMEPTKEEIAKWREANSRMAFSMRDGQVAERIKRDKQDKQDKRDPPSLKLRRAGEQDERDEQRIVLPEGFQIPTRSKRGSLWPKSAENPHAIVEPARRFLLPEVSLTLPEQAVKMLKKLFPGLDTNNWETALKTGIAPAVRGCRSLGIGEERLVIFPWLKREALARLAGLREGTHYGALVEQGIFPKLQKLYKEQNLQFANYRASKMANDNYMQMEQRTAEWLEQSEEEVEREICFSGAILDLFHGYSVNAGRYETEKEKRLIDGTCYVVQQILLTQTQLKTKYEELHWDMPGDRYDSNGNSLFPSSLYCFVYVREFRFVLGNVSHALMIYGSVVFPSEML